MLVVSEVSQSGLRVKYHILSDGIGDKISFWKGTFSITIQRSPPPSKKEVFVDLLGFKMYMLHVGIASSGIDLAAYRNYYDSV
jgi:hypothetical protein